VQEHRRARRADSLPDARWTAGALVGLGTAVNIGRELGLLGSRPRRELFAAVGRRLLG
jgi:hypothetical protein